MKLRPAPLTLLALLSTCYLHAAEFSIQETPGKYTDILQNGKIVGRYMQEHDVSTDKARNDTYKPYLHIFDPAGKEPITKGPGGEYTHHRGIFIGWMKITVDGQKPVDRWHMKNSKGDEAKVGNVTVADIVHQKFLEQKADSNGATLTSQNIWQNIKPGEPMLEEERTMQFLPAPEPAYAMIDFTSKVKAVAGDTTLDGDPEHAGLQFRPSDEVERAKTVYLYPVAKAEPHKDKDYPWVAETFTLKTGGTYSVIYLNHPSNVKNTAFSAYRNYGRFGGFFKGPVKKGETFTAKARFLIIAGEMPSADFIQKQYNVYAGVNEPTPPTTAKAAEQPAPAKPKDDKKKTDPKAPAEPKPTAK